jgi:hypothetical protein
MKPDGRRIDWTLAEFVYVVIPCCPSCKSTKYDSQRSIDVGDGAREKLAICRRCSTPFRICAELPEDTQVEQFPEFGN